MTKKKMGKLLNLILKLTKTIVTKSENDRAHTAIMDIMGKVFNITTHI